jgi:hypothetical protein
MPVFRTRPHAILICCLLLPGCKLVDQRTFDRSAGRAPVPHVPPSKVARGPGPVPPLFVVHSGLADEDWQPDLRQAVGAALARKRNALFTIEGVAPVAASPAAQAAALGDTTASNSRPVADAIIADGAQAAQVEMTAISDPAVHTPEVRVFVR